MGNVEIQLRDLGEEIFKRLFNERLDEIIQELETEWKFLDKGTDVKDVALKVLKKGRY